MGEVASRGWAAQGGSRLLETTRLDSRSRGKIGSGEAILWNRGVNGWRNALTVHCCTYILYFLIKPLPTEIPPDDLLFESGVELHEGGLLDLAISDYDKAIEINRYNLQSQQKRGDAYFAKGDLGHAMVDYNEAISLRSQLISGLGPRKRAAMLSSVAEAYMGKALVYAWQGRDLEAQKIATYAVDFGSVASIPKR